MNINIDESQVIINKQINISNSINKKVNIKDFGYRFAKRTMDIIGSLFGIVALVPVTGILYIARIIIKEDRGPMFYTQERYGKNGQKFKLYKFRSMCIDADEKLREYLLKNEDIRKEFEETQKLKDDPRITKLGDLLRKTSLDELPQMINILKGDMSFIGPRPVIDGEIERYSINRDKFLSVRPGLTGYWQVNGRSNTTYDERMDMELYYIDNKSLLLDIKIFLKTFITVFKREGAM